jgi:hypothetical protein
MRKQSLALNEPLAGTALDRPLWLAPRVTRYLLISRAAGIERAVGVEHTHALAQARADLFNAKVPTQFCRVERFSCEPAERRERPERRSSARNLHAWSSAR